MWWISIRAGFAIFAIVRGCDWNWEQWSPCSKTCGGGTRMRHGKRCSGWWEWGTEHTDQRGACNEFCYNGGDYYGGSCHCSIWRTGSCCESCRYIDIPHCKDFKQQCGGSPDSIRCTDCELPYTPAGWGNGCKRIPCNERNGACDHSCLTERGVARCSCRQGFILSSNGYSCSDIDECKTGEANCDHICINTAGSFQCSCQSGYSLDSDGYHCSDECVTGTTICSQLCVNTNGSFHCACVEGYRLSADEHTCIDINECTINNGGCDQTCVNEKGSFHCECKDGYSLVNQTRCKDLDECSKSTSRCSQICQNNQGSYTCSCTEGFSLKPDGYTCQDIDDCFGVECANGGICKNNIGSYSCSCEKGFTGTHCGNDIDECKGFLHGGCEDICINTVGSFHCQCSGNKSLSADGFSCSGGVYSTSIFERHGIARKLLPRGCSTIVLTRCTEGNKIEVLLSSTSPWFQSRSNNNIIYTFGIVFVELNSLSLPVSITGLELVKNSHNFAIITGSLAFSGKDGQIIGTERHADCVKFTTTPRDIHDILASMSFLKSFFENINKILPNWLSFSHEGTDIFGVNDLQTELKHGMDIQNSECKGAPLYDNRLYTVLKFGSRFSVTLYGNTIILPKPLQNNLFCIIIDICQDYGGSIFLIIPEESRTMLTQLDLFKSLQNKYKIQVLPVGLGLSLLKDIHAPSSTTSLQLWNGDNMFTYSVPDASLWLGGELEMKFGKTFTFELNAQTNIYASVPGIQSILKSVFLDRWDVSIKLRIQGIVGVHFNLFGKKQTIALNVGKADVDAYASLGGVTPRRWCGKNADPPGFFTSLMVDVNPFIGIPILKDWVFDFTTRLDVFLATDPTQKISPSDSIDILHDIVSIKEVVEDLTNTTIVTVFRYSSVLTNTSVLLLHDLQDISTGFLKSLNNFIEDLKETRTLVLDNFVQRLTMLWQNGWKDIENHTHYFLDSIEFTTVIAKYNFTNLFMQQLDKIKSHFRSTVKKLTTQILNIFEDPEGFGIRLRADLKIFHLKFAGVDIEVVYSVDRLGECGRFSSIYSLMKGEKALRIYGYVSTGLIKLAPFIRLNIGTGIEIAISGTTPGNVIAQLHAEVSVLGISSMADVLLTPKGHYFFVEGQIWNVFKAQLNVSFESDRPWNEINTLDVRGKLLADSDEDGSFQDSYLDAFRKLNQKLADEAEKRISGVQNALNSAQNSMTTAQNWLEEKKKVIWSANAAFDTAIENMEYAKQKLEDAKKPFRDAMDTLNDAQRKVDNLCSIRDCGTVCIPGITCSICWTKVWFFEMPYPCCHFTNCMISFPDPICVVFNVGCRAIRAIAYVALEAAKVFVRIPMLALDAAKLAVSGAQFVVDKSRVVLNIASAALDLAKLGIEGAKIVLEGAKIALEAIKKVVSWGLKIVDFVIKYGLQSLIDMRNCGFETKLSVTGSTVFEVECEISVFRSTFNKLKLGINFANPEQSIWQAAKGTVDTLADASKQSERRKREIRSEAMLMLHKVIRETRNADMGDESFDIFVNETIDTIMLTSGFKGNSSYSDYDNRVGVFKDKCDITSVVFSFFSEAIGVLFEITNDTANTMNNATHLEDTLANYQMEHLAGNMSVEYMGINTDVAMSDFNISIDDLSSALENAKQNLSTDPLLSSIDSLSDEAKLFMKNQTDNINNVKIIDQWFIIMSNETKEYFTEDKCISFHDCSHFAVFQLYNVLDGENATNVSQIIDEVSEFEDLFLELIGNTSKTIQEVHLITEKLSKKLLEIQHHNYFCSTAPTVELISRNAFVTKGSTLQLTCNSTGNPDPFIWWYRGDHYLADRSGKDLVITNVSEADANTYYCVAGNLVANITSKPIEMTIVAENPSLVLLPDTKVNSTSHPEDFVPIAIISSTEPGVNVDKDVGQVETAVHDKLVVILGSTVSFVIIVATSSALIIWRHNVRKRNRKSYGIGSIASLNMVRPDVSKPVLKTGSQFIHMKSIDVE